MSIRKYLQDAGLVTVDTPTVAGTVAIPLVTTVPVVQFPAAIPGFSVPTAIDPRALKVIQDKVDKATLPGYTEFVAMLADLLADVPDVNARTRMALKSVMRLRSLTSQQILSAVQERLTLATDAGEHLLASVDQLMKDQVGSKDTAITALKAQEVALEAQITEVRLQQSKLMDERRALESDLKSKHEMLKGAVFQVHGQLETNCDLISHNLI